MKFQEDNNILYPYVSGTELIYEVECNGGVRCVTQYLPEPDDLKQWECFGVDYNENENVYEVFVDTINTY